MAGVFDGNGGEMLGFQVSFGHWTSIHFRWKYARKRLLLHDRHGWVKIAKRNHGESAEQVNPLAELLFVGIG